MWIELLSAFQQGIHLSLRFRQESPYKLADRGDLFVKEVLFQPLGQGPGRSVKEAESFPSPAKPSHQILTWPPQMAGKRQPHDFRVQNDGIVGLVGQRSYATCCGTVTGEPVTPNHRDLEGTDASVRPG